MVGWKYHRITPTMIGWMIGGRMQPEIKCYEGHPPEYYSGLRRLNLRVSIGSRLRSWFWATLWTVHNMPKGNCTLYILAYEALERLSAYQTECSPSFRNTCFPCCLSRSEWPHGRAFLCACINVWIKHIIKVSLVMLMNLRIMSSRVWTCLIERGKALNTKEKKRPREKILTANCRRWGSFPCNQSIPSQWEPQLPILTPAIRDRQEKNMTFSIIGPSISAPLLIAIRAQTSILISMLLRN